MNGLQKTYEMEKKKPAYETVMVDGDLREVPSEAYLEWVESLALNQIKLQKSLKQIEQQLLDRWGFSEYNTILAAEQLKILSFMDWLKTLILNPHAV